MHGGRAGGQLARSLLLGPALAAGLSGAVAAADAVIVAAESGVVLVHGGMAWRGAAEALVRFGAVAGDGDGFVRADDVDDAVAGPHDHLALDSWNRAKLARLRGKRRPPADRTLRRWYARYGPWAGLAMWLEVTADWHDGNPTWP